MRICSATAILIHVTQAHYFSDDPTSANRRTEIVVPLAGQPRTVTTASGVFSGDGIDRGTGVLLAHTPDPHPHGAILDIGCGWGAITLDTALRAPEATVWAIDVNARAREVCAENASALGATNVRVAAPNEVPEHLRFTEIRSNPPIRVGKAVLHEILLTWLPRLEAGGVAYFVVAKQLGALSLERWLRETLAGTHTVERSARSKGFHVIRVTRGHKQSAT